MKRLTLVIYSLSAGGAERVMSILANYWAEKGWPVTLLSFDDGSKDPFYKLHPSIIRRPLGIAGASFNVLQGLINNIKRIRVLRQAIKTSAPEVVIAFTSRVNVQVLLAALGLDLPVVISERTVPAQRSLGRIWNFLRHWCYAKSSCLIVQSQGVLSYFQDGSNMRMRVIPNPVMASNGFGSGLENKKSAPAKKVLLSMGRLTQVKGFDLLLKAFSQVAQNHSDWSLVIWGEGPERGSLEKLRDDLGLHDCVQFPGLTNAPAQEMRRADLFALTSRWEGFPNVICEAMVCGLPVISFDCPHGPREIIRENIDGILVPHKDVDALAASLHSLMGNEAERNRLSARAPEVLERFGLKKVMGMWEEELNATLERSINEQKI